jgi:WD40 repeat protein
MQGFPGKVRQIVWSEGNSPLLISSSVEGIVTWTKDPDERVGWNPTILNFHQETVQAIAFQPKTRLLASAAEDGLICLWYQAKALSSVLEGAVGGFSTLSWHPQGNKLAAGSSQGELLIWSSSMAGQGFGR